MTVNFNLFNIIILFGTLQGLIITCMLLYPDREKRQNRYFLAAFMLMLIYDSFGTFCWSSGFTIQWLLYFDDIFPYMIILTAGPSLYLYIRTTIKPGRLPAGAIFKTYLPAVTDFAFRCCFVIYYLLYKNENVSGIDPRYIDAVYQPLARALMVVVFWFYLVAAIRLFKRREPELQGTDAAAAAGQRPAARWTKALLTIMTLIAVVWTATIFGSLLFNFQGIVYFSPIEIILMVFTYWIGLKGYQHTRVIYISEQKAAKSYADILPADEANTCIALLKKSMEIDKLYLDPTLTVSRLAATLDLNPRIISAVLNRVLQKGFSEFVNGYRVNEVKIKMLKPENKHITIAGIAFESGFNSVATFQRTFKSVENITPKQFMLNYKNNNKIVLKT